MMIKHVLANRQCSAFQSIASYEYPLGVNEHLPVLERSLVITRRREPAPTPEDCRASTVPPELSVVEKDEHVKSFTFCDKLAQISSVTAGTVTTYALHNYLEPIGPVLASGIVAIVSTVCLKEQLALAALCGSFAGMVSTTVKPTLWLAFLLGLTCAAVLTVFDKKAWFVGYGGRLGFISRCACTLLFLINELVVWLLGSPSASSSPSGTSMLVNFGLYKTITVRQSLSVVFFSVVGALFVRLYKHLMTQTHCLKVLPSRLSNSVAAVGLTGLIGGFLPPIVGGPAYCGSFVAMSSPAILPNFCSLVVACILAGLSQLALIAFLLGGWGGKLGTAAFLGVVLYRWLVVKAFHCVASAFCQTKINVDTNADGRHHHSHQQGVLTDIALRIRQRLRQPQTPLPR